MHDSKTEQTNSRLDEESVHIRPTADWSDPDADSGLDGFFVDAVGSMNGEFGVCLSIHHRCGYHRTNLSRSQAEQMRDALNKLLGVA